MRDEERSLTGIIGDVADHVQRIVRAEVRLARAEIHDEMRRIGRASALMAAGAVAAVLALGLLLLAGVYALSGIMTPVSAALLMGAVAAAIALTCVVAGWNRMGGISLPRTRATVQENLQWAKTRAR